MDLNPDPWKWSVSDVQHFFGRQAADYVADIPGGRLPPPEAFAMKLGENEVNGAQLLMGVDAFELRDSLGVRAIPEKSAVLRCIQKLRKKSAIYAGDQSGPPQVSTSKIETEQRSAPRPKPEDEQAPSQIGRNVRDGEAFVEDATGRRRRKLALLKPQPTKVEGELDNGAFPIDRIFYGDTGFSQEIGPLDPRSKTIQPKDTSDTESESDNWQFVNPKRRAHEVVFVYRRMQHFLHSAKEVDLTREGKEAVAVLPYPSSLHLRNRPSATVFQFRRNHVEAIAVREHVAQLEGDPSPDDDVPEDAGEWGFLVSKYREDSADVLPRYGESESDDYDAEQMYTGTDADAEPEAAESVAPDELEKQKISDIVDEAISGCVREWKEKLPTLEAKRAWTVWKKTKGSRTIRAGLIDSAKNKIVRLTARLDQIKAQLLESDWNSEHSLREACAGLEPTVEDREEHRWMIDVWQRREEPPHVIHHKATSQSNKDIRGQLRTGLVIPEHDRFSATAGQVSHVYEPSCDEEQAVPGTEAEGELTTYEADDEINTPPQNEPETPGSLASGGHIEAENANATPRSIVSQPPRSPSIDGANADTTDVIDLCSLPDDPASPPPRHVHYPRLPTTPDIAPTSMKSGSKSLPIDVLSSSDGSRRIKTRPAPAPVKRRKLESSNPLMASAAQVDAWTTDELAAKDDRHRMLIKLLRHHGSEFRESIHRQQQEGAITLVLRQALEGIQKGGPTGGKSAEDKAMITLAKIYLQWFHCSAEEPHSLDDDQWRQLWEDEMSLTGFERQLRQALLKNDSPLFNSTKTTPKVTQSVSARSSAMRTAISSDDEESPMETPRKKRKLPVDRNQSGCKNRDKALGRQSHYQSQTANSSQQALMVDDANQSGLIINPAKNEHEDFIYIIKPIAERMKPHQLEGARFLWREITAHEDDPDDDDDEESNGNGCILAHTMGLGKTMQTIACLAALNEASRATRAGTYKQLPTKLQLRGGRRHKRLLRIIILCPAGLIFNWLDEIDKWAGTRLGSIFCLDSVSKRHHGDKLRTWKMQGGVAILGYEMFRNLATGKLTKTGPSEDEVAEQSRLVLEAAEVVVADEAHALKNEQSGVAAAASRFRTATRVALTGTPMSNDVKASDAVSAHGCAADTAQEIYALVSWVSPGYLGDPLEFKAHFTEPIEHGLYRDSTYYERRQSAKKLAVLHSEIQPKVNRANIEVLRGSLKPKIEFVIFVSLTAMQNTLYTRFIQAARGEIKKEHVYQTALWGMISILGLLNNHPSCFSNKLREQPKKSNQRPNGKSLRLDGLEDGEETQDEPGTGDVTSATRNSGNSTPRLGELATMQQILDAEAEGLGEDHRSKYGVNDQMVKEILAGLVIDTDPELSTKVSVFLKLLDRCLEVQDKVIVFSMSIPTLNYLQNILQHMKTGRIDGSNTGSRDKVLEAFARGDFNVMLVSTKAGGVGLNMQCANRVFIFDSGFNPTYEEQAIGRAYRLGQQKPVYVYRFVAAGTFESNIYNKQLFKTSLAQRVVDKKNPRRTAERNARDYLYEPRPVPQTDLSLQAGRDPAVLDPLIATESPIRAVQTMETLTEEAVDEPLNAEERAEVALEMQMRKLRPRGRKIAPPPEPPRLPPPPLQVPGWDARALPPRPPPPVNGAGAEASGWGRLR